MLTEGKDYPVRPVPFTQVEFTDTFWAPRIATNCEVTISFAFEQCERSGRMDGFDRAAAILRGENVINLEASEYPFDDTDPYKVIEGASFAMAVKPDEKLDRYVDALIARIAAAQEPDGYLYTTRTINPQRPHVWAGSERWVLERDLSHELYNLGHLYEAAVAHYQATGKRSLLDIALKTADLLDRTFGPGKQAIWPGHQITEMGLVRLYRVTGDERYLKLAKFLLDVRGPDGHKASGIEYNQSHKPVVEQREAVGHAVRATYMYAGMADVAALTGDASYVQSIQAIWENIVSAKLYITGGIGATAQGEAFGANYELPNMTAYNETCAAIGNVYLNHRLFLLTGEGKYIDVLERTLYNGLLSGVSLDGKSFFYPNPLESKGQHARSPWFGCACCPSNVCRFMASIPGYAYAQRDGEIYVNLFASGKAKLQLAPSQIVELHQETRYPWDGRIRITVYPHPGAADFGLCVRIPGWARGEALPSDLYRFLDGANEKVTLRLNGESVTVKVSAGYVKLHRTWSAGDTIELDLPMKARRVVAHDKVVADRGRVALERGPVVYCFEWADNPNVPVRNVLVGDDAAVTAEQRTDLLGGVVTLRTKGRSLSVDEADKLLSTEVELLAIPYFAWANRGKGDMAVWVAREQSALKPAKPRSIVDAAQVSTSPGAHHAESIKDRITGGAIGDEVGPPMNWWPRPSTGSAWVQYTFAKAVQLSESSVYWFSDSGTGNCRVPRAWRLMYLDHSAGESGTWRPVVLKKGSHYTTVERGFNTMSFEKVTTTALRLEIDLLDGHSGGVEEWSVR